MRTRGLNAACTAVMAVSLAGGLAAGCGGESTGDGAYVTSVKHEADGTTSEKTVWLSADELATLDSQREHLAALGSSGAAPAFDGTCAGASMWIYDNSNQTGNRICFAGPASVDNLASYAAPGGGTWATKTKSCWGGAYNAWFRVASSGSWYAVGPYYKDNIFFATNLLQQQ